MFNRRKFKVRLASRTLFLGPRTQIMGVLNVTPDSFSDGGKFLDTKKAVRHALLMEQAGADILDIGGESTRPGSLPVSTTEEIRRILPVLEKLRGRLKIPISIDTQKSLVAEVALKAGAQIINDISGLRNNSHLATIAAEHRVPLILMHIRGNPRTMQNGPFARDVMQDVTRGLRWSITQARKAGVAKSQIILDPGIGFGKTFAQNFALLRKLPQLARLGYPLIVGTSRKGFLGGATAGLPQASTDNRIWGTAATVTASILGGAHIVRVHDVAEMVQVARVADSLLEGGRHAK